MRSFNNEKTNLTLRSLKIIYKIFNEISNSFIFSLIHLIIYIFLHLLFIKTGTHLYTRWVPFSFFIFIILLTRHGIRVIIYIEEKMRKKYMNRTLHKRFRKGEIKEEFVRRKYYHTRNDIFQTKKLLVSIYGFKEEENLERIKDELESVILLLFNSSKEETYIGLTILQAQLENEANGISPFEIDKRMVNLSSDVVMFMLFKKERAEL